MRTIKRIIRLLLVCVAIFGMSACGGNAGTNETTAATTAAVKDGGTITVVEGKPITQLDNVREYVGVTGETMELPDLPIHTVKALAGHTRIFPMIVTIRISMCSPARMQRLSSIN